MFCEVEWDNENEENWICYIEYNLYVEVVLWERIINRDVYVFVSDNCINSSVFNEINIIG